MAKLRFLKDGVTKEEYFLETDTGMSFRRTTAALVWPCGERPGCLVALGETRSKQNIVGMERHDVHKLQELQSADTSELMEEMVRFGETWLIRQWATPLCDKRAYLLEDINLGLRQRRRPVLRYGDPPGWSGKGEGLLSFYHALVQRRTMSEKTLFIGSGQCADEIGSFKFEDANKSILEYPSGAALCFALAGIDLNVKGVSRLSCDCFGPADDLGGY